MLRILLLKEAKIKTLFDNISKSGDSGYTGGILLYNTICQYKNNEC
jgi:hypothetical protein